MTAAHLKRSLSLPLVTFYGIGSIVGAGIYVLLGTVGAAAGPLLPIAFLCATIIAGFTAFSYAELASRLPLSGGEAVYVQEAFRQRWLTLLVGYSASVVGIVSAATIVSGLVGYVDYFITIERRLVIVGVVCILGLITAIGIGASAWTASLMTVASIGGLLLIIGSAVPDLITWTGYEFGQVLPQSIAHWQAVAAGAFLAFYAFLGFEDMVNVAEEVKDPSRNMPLAITIALIAASGLYLLTAFAALASVPIEELATSSTPIALIANAHGISETLMSIIALLAITNGALVQIIKTSRILYGMAGLGDAPQSFAYVSPLTSTPLVTTAVTSALVLILAMWFSTAELAALTSLITLLIFALVNVALYRLKQIESKPPKGFSVPTAIPLCGAALCISLILLQLF